MLDDYTPDPETAAASERLHAWFRARILRVLAEPQMPEKPAMRQEPPPKPVAPPVAPKRAKPVLPKVAPVEKPTVPAEPPKPFGGECGRTGRPRKVSREDIERLRAEGLSMREVAERLNCSKMQVWRAVGGSATFDRREAQP